MKKLMFVLFCLLAPSYAQAQMLNSPGYCTTNPQFGGGSYTTCSDGSSSQTNPQFWWRLHHQHPAGLSAALQPGLPHLHFHPAVRRWLHYQLLLTMDDVPSISACCPSFPTVSSGTQCHVIGPVRTRPFGVDVIMSKLILADTERRILEHAVADYFVSCEMPTKASVDCLYRALRRASRIVIEMPATEKSRA
jgi:hypothetical protein